MTYEWRAPSGVRVVSSVPRGPEHGWAVLALLAWRYAVKKYVQGVYIPS